ncbi:MAG: flagellar filament capping protein FliD [Planctomycetes bacterium]|nr:flagellar filament capping protein FliD [Planctomycetota bacterium]
MSALSFTGLLSGLDTNNLVSELLRFNQRRVDLLELRKAEAELDLALFDEIETRARSLQSSVGQLSSSINSVFAARSATSSDEAILTVAAGTGAQPGSTTFRVNQQARANQEASQGFADASSQIQRGTFQISAGGGTATIAIDNTNDTLQGLAQAINSSGVGVSASVVNTGVGTTPFRLLLTSNQTGTAGAISITNNLTDGSQPGSVQPLFSTVQAAENSQLQIGSGAGAIVIENSSNQVQGVIPGVTLNIVGADPGRDVTVTVGNNTSAAAEAVKNFVEDFNDLQTFIDENSAFDAEKQQGGPLLGDRNAINIQESLRRIVTSANPLLPSTANRLSILGVTVNSQGLLDLDEARLNNVLNGNVPGVTFQDVQRALGFGATSNNPGVEFIVGGSRTREGLVQVDITQAAERATIAATNNLAASTVINAANNEFTVTVNGRASSTVALTPGTYTQQQLAQELETRINADSTLTGRSVSVSLNGSRLVITSDRFGFDSEVASLTGTAAGSLGFTGAENDRGRDVVGRFVVGGQTETAIGRGQALVGDPSNANTADLRVLVTLGPSQVVAGPEAELTVTRGIGSQLQETLGRFLDPIDGRFRSIDDGIETRIEQFDDSIKREERRLDDREAALLRQFAAVEQLIGQSQARSEQFTAQLLPLLNQGR